MGSFEDVIQGYQDGSHYGPFFTPPSSVFYLLSFTIKAFNRKRDGMTKFLEGGEKKNLSRRDLALPCRRIPKTDGNLLLVCLCTCFAFTYV